LSGNRGRLSAQLRAAEKNALRYFSRAARLSVRPRREAGKNGPRRESVRRRECARDFFERLGARLPRDAGEAAAGAGAMKVIGLTGGMGSGKSAVARMFVEWGAPVIDADLIAREVVEPGEPALAEIARAFGSGILDEKGALDRKKLGALVF